MENQKKTLLIRPSMAPKTNPKENLCSAMGASTWFLCVTFHVFLQRLCKSFQKPGKSHTKLGKRLCKVQLNASVHLFG